MARRKLRPASVLVATADATASSDSPPAIVTPTSARLRRELASATEARAINELELLNAIARLEADRGVVVDRLAGVERERDEARRRLGCAENASTELGSRLKVKEKELRDAMVMIETSTVEVEELRAALALASESSVGDGVSLDHLAKVMGDGGQDEVEAAVVEARTAVDIANSIVAAKSIELSKLRSTLRESKEQLAELAERDNAKKEEIETLKSLLREFEGKMKGKMGQAREVTNLKVMFDSAMSQEATDATEDLKMAITDRDQRLQEKSRINNQLELKLGKIEATLALFKRERSELMSNSVGIAGLQKKVAILQAELEERKRNNTRYATQVREMESKIAQYEKETEAVRIANVSVGPLLEEISYLKKCLSAKSVEMNLMESTLSDLKGAKVDMQYQIKSLDEERVELQSKIADQVRAEMKDQMDKVLEDYKREIRTLEQDLENSLALQGDMKRELRNNRSTINKLELEKDAVASEVKRHLQQISLGNMQMQEKLRNKEDEVDSLSNQMVAFCRTVKGSESSGTPDMKRLQCEVEGKSLVIAEQQSLIKLLRKHLDDIIAEQLYDNKIKDKTSVEAGVTPDPVAISPSRSFATTSEVENENERVIHCLLLENGKLGDEVRCLSEQLYRLKGGVGDMSAQTEDVERARRRLDALEKSIVQESNRNGCPNITEDSERRLAITETAL